MPSGAAGVGSKSSLKGRHEDQCALGEPNDDGPTGLCAPTGIAIPIAPLQTWTSWTPPARPHRPACPRAVPRRKVMCPVQRPRIRSLFPKSRRPCQPDSRQQA